MNTEAKIVLHALLQPELARFGNCSTEYIENKAIKSSIIKLATGVANEIDVIDDLILDEAIQLNEFIGAVTEMPRISQIQYQDLFHELKREKLIAIIKNREEERNPHSHTMAEAVVSVHNNTVRRAIALGDKNAPSMIKAEK